MKAEGTLDPRPAAARARPAPLTVHERLPAENLTPMMRQYLSVKAAHPGAVVLFRMGDFFETFFEDAETCARLLDIALTARSKERDIPMAGVPHHAIDGYLARLIEHGCTVVLVDQVEDPKQAKGLVRREVTRILTPGTFLDPNAPARVPTYLVALAAPEGAGKKKRPQASWGLAAFDLATGELRATTCEDEELLMDELARLGMREVLVAEPALGEPHVERIRRDLPKVVINTVDPARYRPAALLEVLARVLGPDEVTGARSALPEHSLFAAGMALRYAEEAQLRPEAPDLGRDASLRHVERLVPYVPGDALVLDAQAREHLELFRAQGDGGRKGSLLGAIDECCTAMGGRLLARWLAYPLREVRGIAARQDAVEALVAQPSLLDALREQLGGVSDLERLVGRVAMGRANPRDLVALAGSLERAPALLAAARSASRDAPDSFEGTLAGEGEPPTRSSRLALLAATDPCADVFDTVRRALVDDPPVDLEVAQVFREGWDAELDRLTELSRNGKGTIAALEATERERTGISSLKIRYNKVFGYYIEVTKTNLDRVPKGYVRKQTTVGAERFFTEELKALEDEVLSAEEKRVARTVDLYAKLLTQVAGEVRRLRALASALAELDVFAAFARIAERRAWVRPVVDESGVLEIGEGRHPVIELLSEELGERFVPNDVILTADERLVIITGPNMAGKSTIMRQTALIVILAHMGAFVPARAARVGLVDRVFTRVGASDDLSRGRSTFMVEMSETARILRSATARSLILLDEIGRGTSTFDGLSIAWAVAEHLHDAVGAKTLFATHYHELTEICRDKAKAVNRHVAVREYNEQIVFLRKLLPGATNRSYGVQVGRLAGLPKSVVERAKAVLEALEAQALSAGDASAVTHLVRVRSPRGRSPGQLHLFAADPPEPEAPLLDPVSAEVLAELGRLDVDGLTPREALSELARLQTLLKSGGR